MRDTSHYTISPRTARVSPLAVAACAAAVYFLDFYVLSALLFAVAAHELGHVACLRAFGLDIRDVSVDAGGLCIDYRGECGALIHALAAAAGPAVGIAYAYLCSYLGIRLRLAWLQLGAGLSLILSLYNLLPVMPLDGGRLFAAVASALIGERRGDALSAMLSAAVCAILLILGVRLFARSCGAGLLIAAMCLIHASCKERARRGY